GGRADAASRARGPGHGGADRLLYGAHGGDLDHAARPSGPERPPVRRLVLPAIGPPAERRPRAPEPAALPSPRPPAGALASPLFHALPGRPLPGNGGGSGEVDLERPTEGQLVNWSISQLVN